MVVMANIHTNVTCACHLENSVMRYQYSCIPCIFYIILVVELILYNGLTLKRYHTYDVLDANHPW